MSQKRALSALLFAAVIAGAFQNRAIRAQAVPWPSLPAAVDAAIARVPGAEVAVSIIDLADDRA